MNMWNCVQPHENTVEQVYEQVYENIVSLFAPCLWVIIKRDMLLFLN